MKTLIALFFLFTTIYQAHGQRYIYDDLTTIRNEGIRIRDSLITRGVDTIFSYYIGSAACPSLPPLAIIYWQQNSQGKIFILRQGVKHKGKKSHFVVAQFYFECLVEESPISYFEQNFSLIVQDSINETHNLYVLNHTFEAMHVILGTKKMEYSFNTLARQYNSTSYKIAFIDRFRSFILKFYTTY